MTQLQRYEQLFVPQEAVGLSVLTRVTLYKLLETLVSLDNLIVNHAIKDRRFCDFLMVSSSLRLNVQDDFERYESNSLVLS